MTKEGETNCNSCEKGHSLGVVRSKSIINGKRIDNCYIGCLDCEEPLVIESSGDLNLEIKKKASPSC